MAGALAYKCESQDGPATFSGYGATREEAYTGWLSLVRRCYTADRGDLCQPTHR